MKKLLLLSLLFVGLNVRAGWQYDEILKIWFNTETGEIMIVGDDEADGDVGSIMVYDSFGNIVNAPIMSNGGNNYTVRTENLLQGVYFIVIANHSQTSYITKKITITK